MSAGSRAGWDRSQPTRRRGVGGLESCRLGLSTNAGGERDAGQFLEQRAGHAHLVADPQDRQTFGTPSGLVARGLFVCDGAPNPEDAGGLDNSEKFRNDHMSTRPFRTVRSTEGLS